MNKWRNLFYIILTISVLNYLFLIPPIIKDVSPNIFYRDLKLSLGGRVKTKNGHVLKVKPAGKRGFNFSYYLYIPENIKSKNTTYLLAEPNNTGTCSDNIEDHDTAALNRIVYSGTNRLATDLNVPLLIPVFPRPESDWQYYTHSLDRDTIYIKKGDLVDLDKQFKNILNDAKQKLNKYGIKTYDRVLLNGFSASGTFVNRYSALYPMEVKAVAAGGVNSMPIIPYKEYNGYILQYPIGIAENRDITGKEFNMEAFNKIDQFIYMGDIDDNDTLYYLDAFSIEERELIINVLGEKMSERWVNSNIFYSQIDNAELKLYKGVGHEVTEGIYQDILNFFKSSIH